MAKEEDKPKDCPPHRWGLIFRGEDYTIWRCRKCPVEVVNDKQGPPDKDKPK